MYERLMITLMMMRERGKVGVKVKWIIIIKMVKTKERDEHVYQAMMTRFPIIVTWIERERERLRLLEFVTYDIC